MTYSGVPKCVYLSEMSQQFVADHKVEKRWGEAVVEMVSKTAKSKYTCDQCNYATNYIHNLKTHITVSIRYQHPLQGLWFFKYTHRC